MPVTTYEKYKMYGAWRCCCMCDYCWPFGSGPSCTVLLTESTTFPGQPDSNLCKFCERNCENDHRCLDGLDLRYPATSAEMLKDVFKVT